jgi:hypothetical protein
MGQITATNVHLKRRKKCHAIRVAMFIYWRVMNKDRRVAVVAMAPTGMTGCSNALVAVGRRSGPLTPTAVETKLADRLPQTPDRVFSGGVWGGVPNFRFLHLPRWTNRPPGGRSQVPHLKGFDPK